MEVKAYCRTYMKRELVWAFLGCVISGCILLLLMQGTWERGFYAQSVSQETLANSDIIRVHVIANSDSEADQALKNEIRNEMTVYFTEILSDVTTKEETEQILLENQIEILKRAEETIAGAGYEYAASVELDIRYFEEKTLGNTVYPAGNYEALIITIGEGKGHNWWGLMYPNLCFVPGTYTIVDEGANAQTSNALLYEDEPENVWNADVENIVIKSKLLEILQK